MTRCPIIQKHLSLLIFCLVQSNSKLCTQLQGSTHTAAESTKPLRTQLQSLLLLPNLTWTYRLKAILLLQTHTLQILTKIYLIPLEPRFIYTSHGPQTMGRLTRFLLFYIIFGRTNLWLDQLQVMLHALRGTFTISLPKIVGFKPQSHYAGDLLPNWPPTQSSWLVLSHLLVWKVAMPRHCGPPSLWVMHYVLLLHPCLLQNSFKLLLHCLY